MGRLLPCIAAILEREAQNQMRVRSESGYTHVTCGMKDDDCPPKVTIQVDMLLHHGYILGQVDHVPKSREAGTGGGGSNEERTKCTVTSPTFTEALSR
jgi:hypothetical protein